MKLKTKEWNQSYNNKDNFVFYPHEEVIRFVSKYIKKRVGLNDFIEIHNKKSPIKVLDFGCGIGRHVRLLNEFELDSYGFDLSNIAIDYAKNMFTELKLNNLISKVRVADIQNLPYKDEFFDFMLSHGVLDSMPFNIARTGLIELHRCLMKNGLIYFDLISTEDTSFEGNYEKIIKSKHENNTIQSYFDIEKIEKLIENRFIIREIIHVKRDDILQKKMDARYSIVCQKI